MTADYGVVLAHYGRPDLAQAILDALAASGKDVARLAPDDLAAVDEFHTRGRAATTDLAGLLALSEADRVLDVGSGIGGPSRYLAHRFGCQVTGVDLSDEFCRTAAVLADLTGLADKVTYRQGNALAMPFAAESFDVAWSQNVVMNIADRGGFYAEIRRTLVPGGKYAFSDVVAGDDGEAHFPLPWAREPSINFLLSAQATKDALEAAGFEVAVMQDQTADALVQAERLVARMATTPPAIGLHLLLGDDWYAMAGNLARNLREGRIGLVQGVAIRRR